MSSDKLIRAGIGGAMEYRAHVPPKKGEERMNDEYVEGMVTAIVGRIEPLIRKEIESGWKEEYRATLVHDEECRACRAEETSGMVIVPAVMCFCSMCKKSVPYLSHQVDEELYCQQCIDAKARAVKQTRRVSPWR